MDPEIIEACLRQQLMAELAMKEKSGKDRYDLLPVGPINTIVQVYNFGAVKYADENWRKGIPFKDAFAALMRHVEAARGGEWINEESGLPHMAHAAWWCIALLEFANTHPELNNVVGYEPGTLNPVRAAAPTPPAA